MKPIIATLLFLFASVWLYAEEEPFWYYNEEGGKITLTVRNDAVFIQFKPDTDINAFLKQGGYTNVVYVTRDNGLACTIDPLQTNLNTILDNPMVSDAIYMFGTNKCLYSSCISSTGIYISCKPDESIDHILDVAGFSDKVVSINGGIIELDIRLGDVLDACVRIYETGLCEFVDPLFLVFLDDTEIDYFPLLINGEWLVDWWSTADPEECEDGSCFMGVETLRRGEQVSIGGVKYYEILSNGIHLPATDNFELKAYLREVNRTIFFYDPVCEKELPLYDFSHGKSSVFVTDFSSYNCESEAEEVQIITDDRVSIIGYIDRKHLVLEGGNEWIEGVGSIRGLLSSHPKQGNGMVSQLRECNDFYGRLVYYRDEPLNYYGTIKTEAAAADNLSIYPNPFERDICVEYSTEELKSLALYDQSGRRVFQKGVEGFKACIESNLPPGTYALVIETASGKQYSKKIIKQ